MLRTSGPLVVSLVVTAHGLGQEPHAGQAAERLAPDSALGRTRTSDTRFRNLR